MFGVLKIFYYLCKTNILAMRRCYHIRIMIVEAMMHASMHSSMRMCR